MKNTMNEFDFDFLKEFDEIATKWLQKDERNIESKLGYAIQKIFKQMKRIVDDSNDYVKKTCRELEVESYVTDKNGYLLKDDKGLPIQTTKSLADFENKKFEFIGSYNKEFGSKKFEIEPYFATKVPDTLNQFEIEVFTGLVINPSPTSSN